METASLKTLENAILKPGIESKLIPLLAYRGRADLGSIHRKWNLVIAAMEQGAESIGEVVKVHTQEQYAKLTGLRSKYADNTTLNSFFSRLADNPSVTDNIPGLTKFVRQMPFYCFNLINVPLESPDSRCAFWRKYTPVSRPYIPRPPREPKPTPASALFYPYLVHEPTKADDLTMLVNAAVPEYLPDWFRADLCQDLAVAVLTGEIARSELADKSKAFLAKAIKLYRPKYGHLSLDAPCPWLDGKTFASILPAKSED